MKKIKILIPSLLLTTVSPIVSLTSCAKDKNVSYLEISETGKTMVKVIISKKKKELLAPETFPHTLSEYYNRPEDYMETSTAKEIENVREDPNFGDDVNRFVNYSGWTDHTATYTITPEDGEYERVVFFIHGGAYAKNIQYSHIKTCLELSEKLNAKFYIPLHPVMPQHKADECFDFVLRSYAKTLKQEQIRPILMGDSSGAGLALALSQYLYNESLIQLLPLARVLFSPWVDVTLTNKKIDDYLDRDIMLHPYGLQFYGRLWSDIEGWSVNDYRVSPINGEMEDKIKTLNVVGSEEIFYPDIRLLHKKLLDGGCNSQLIIANGLFHDFETFSDLPAAALGWKTIPEVEELYDRVAQFLND